ncbi:hypothetical protein RhiirA4_459885 [Rhizophagus irregularis]|uniref:Uncharacterized protein n=1 Tax=Rhizophagus irregularis TaxID=588596 RepID=A0A2I1GFE2_9GLOM|nr:hypothetical protein RhiirA4_459885 [Rhizophagus irregularis]
MEDTKEKFHPRARGICLRNTQGLCGPSSEMHRVDALQILRDIRAESGRQRNFLPTLVVSPDGK